MYPPPKSATAYEKFKFALSFIQLPTLSSLRIAYLGKTRVASLKNANVLWNFYYSSITMCSITVLT